MSVKKIQDWGGGFLKFEFKELQTTEIQKIRLGFYSKKQPKKQTLKMGLSESVKKLQVSGVILVLSTRIFFCSKSLKIEQTNI